MRTVELAKVAAAAEALRLRRMAQRQGMRAAYGAGAAVFAIAVFVLVHVVVYDLLVGHLSPVISALILLVADLVVAGVLGMMAMSSKPSAVEVEALEVRRQAMIEMRKSATAMSLLSQVGSMVLRRRAVAAVAPTRSTRAWLLGEIAGRLLARR